MGSFKLGGEEERRVVTAGEAEWEGVWKSRTRVKAALIGETL
jgi:hypothetical protein